MWYKTKLAGQLGIQYPIIQGPFGGGPSSVKLLSTVSNAGGLGSFGAYGLSPQQITDLDKEIKGSTNRPYAINLWVTENDERLKTYSKTEYDQLVQKFKPYFDELGVPIPGMPMQFGKNFEEQLESLLKAKPPVFSFVYGIPSKLMKFIIRAIIFVGISFLCPNILFAQTILEKLNDIKSAEQAEYFLYKNPGLKADLILLNRESDTSSSTREIFNKKNQEVFTSGSYTCKIVEKKKALLFRASYIYFDGSRLSMKKIDSLRSIILEKYKQGISFSDLFKEYNMDGNTTGPDLGYFEEGAMAGEFENAVRSRKKDEIFKVDVPNRNWYYVVKKTHDNIFTPVVRILRVETAK